MTKIHANEVRVGDTITTWSKYGAGECRHVVTAVETFLDGQAYRYTHDGGELVVPFYSAIGRV